MIPSGSALQAQSAAPRSVSETLSPAQVEPMLAETLARWHTAGIETNGLGNVEVRITDLGGTTLGLASGYTIWLDDNTAGWGWFVDPTPWGDSEFTTTGDQGEQNRIDLLSALIHEIGHLLDYEHEHNGVMDETLSPGERLTPDSVAVDTFWPLGGLPDLAKKHAPFGSWL